MAHTLSGTKIHFAETMSGYVASGASSFADGFQNGQATGQSLSLSVSVDIPDLQAFLQSAQHSALLSGFVEGPVLGGRATIESGHFHLLPTTADLNRRVMNYRVLCRNSTGELFTVAGQKEVQHQFGFDLWSDTTTLYVNVFAGDVSAEEAPGSKIVATGILHLGVIDFMNVLRSITATQGDGSNSVMGLARFGEFFAGSLWQLYGPALPPKAQQKPRKYALHTTEGVNDASISEYPFHTADGIGLKLTRFQRHNSDDVVLLIHGLTTSSDMYIMPEHENLVNYLHDNGYGDVWALDYRGSNRFPYNLARNQANLDDIALFDHPAAIATLRQHIGQHRRIHVIAHCVGALSFSMSLFGGTVTGISSAILNSVSLTPYVPAWSRVKLAVGPFACDYLLGVDYFNPQWRWQRGWSAGKLLAYGVDFFHRECDSPVCHMLSFMWGGGTPALFKHENLAQDTHDRLGDLFGGVNVNYYRHVLKMVKANHTAVKFDPDNRTYDSLPNDYMARAGEITTPLLLSQGQENYVFADSNINSFERLNQVVPGRHQLHVFPNYGHQDVFMGKNSSQDIFPHFLEFLRRHSGV